jgi:hypothetical protein
MPAVVTCLSLLVLLVGCETEADRYAHETAKLRERITAIPAGQPVCQADANLLAAAYWRRTGYTYGTVYPVHDAGTNWAAKMVLGRLPIDPINLLASSPTPTYLAPDRAVSAGTLLLLRGHLTGPIPSPAPDILVEKSTGHISLFGWRTVTNWTELSE